MASEKKGCSEALEEESDKVSMLDEVLLRFSWVSMLASRTLRRVLCMPR